MLLWDIENVKHMILLRDEYHCESWSSHFSVWHNPKLFHQNLLIYMLKIEMSVPNAQIKASLYHISTVEFNYNWQVRRSAYRCYVIVLLTHRRLSALSHWPDGSVGPLCYTANPVKEKNELPVRIELINHESYLYLQSRQGHDWTPSSLEPNLFCKIEYE